MLHQPSQKIHNAAIAYPPVIARKPERVDVAISGVTRFSTCLGTYLCNAVGLPRRCAPRNDTGGALSTTHYVIANDCDLTNSILLEALNMF